jgi:hypothetical protein
MRRRKIILDYDMAMAAGADAANRKMRSEGRTVWNESDWNTMCEEFERIMLLARPSSEGEPSEARTG